MNWRQVARDSIPLQRSFLAAVGATYLWHLYLIIGARGWHAAVASSLAWAPVIFLPFWAVYSSLALMRRALGPADPDGPPAKPGGWSAAGALIASAAHLVLFSLLLAAGALVVFRFRFGLTAFLEVLPVPAVDWFAGFLTRGYSIVLLGALVVAALVQLAYLLSRYVDYMGGWMTLWLSMMLVWAELRLAPVVGGWLFWLPDLRYRELTLAGEAYRFRTAYLDSGPYAFALLSALIAVAASCQVLKLIRQQGTDGDTLSRKPWPDPDEASIGEEGAIRPRIRVSLREKLLVTILGFSLVFAFDLTSNSRAALSQLDQVFARPPADRRDLGFVRDDPFLQKGGTLTHPANGITTLAIEGEGDITLLGSGSDTGGISVDYTVRTFAFSARRAQDYHERVAVRLEPDGDRLRLYLHAPESDTERADTQARVRYVVHVPNGLHTEIRGRYGLVLLHRIAGSFDVTLESATFQGSELAGPVRLRGQDSDVWVTNIEGDVDLDVKSGRVQLHGVDGSVKAAGAFGSLALGDVAGSVTLSLDRSTGAIAEVKGPVHVAAYMTRLEAGGLGDRLEIEAEMSPVWVRGLQTPATITSDRGNVRVTLLPSAGWEIEAEATNGRIESDLPGARVERGSTGERLTFSAGDARNRFDLRVSGANASLSPFEESIP